MDQPARTCPECGSGEHAFRGRKKIEPGDGQEAAVETKYRCKACGHEWKVRVGAKGRAN
jgi:DNA-directed RNA polymerase subunit M/transcription elongation factor TFIIS